MSLEVIEAMKEYKLASYQATCGNPARHHKVKRQQMLEQKEFCMEKLFLATLWAKLVIITVNFGNKTKVFSENFLC